VEPRGGRRQVQVSARRTKVDFVHFVRDLSEGEYAHVGKLHVVLDNLNTHFARSFREVPGPVEAAKLLRRIEFHCTPKHASWLNMAELEIGIMERQCTGTRVESAELLADEPVHWQREHNARRQGINWGFSRADADRKLSRHYIT
jgi:hypothetical protein